MYRSIPVQVWLLIGVAFAAYVPARYVYRYAVHSPSRRDITQPSEDLSWRTSGDLARNLAILGALAVFAIFIFTPAAAAFARSPSFFPILIAAMGVWSIVTVVRGYSTGKIEPMTRGSNTYERATQPKRFWASMLWNTLMGVGFVVGGFLAIKDAPIQALKDRCFDAKDAFPPKEELSACDQLIAKPGTNRDDMARLVAARGSAYFRRTDYRHAVTEYARATLLDPHDYSSYYNLGLVHERLGNRDAALTDYDAAIREGSANGDAYLNRGAIFLELGKLDQAVADFTRAHELNPKDAMALADRGVSYAWKRDKDRAQQDLSAAQVLDPSNRIVLHGEAVLSMNSRDFVGAIDHLSTALTRDPRDAWALAARANAYRQLGDDEKMRADQKALARLKAVSNEAER